MYWNLFIAFMFILQLYLASMVISMSRSKDSIENSNVLLVTAHPDDECM